VLASWAEGETVELADELRSAGVSVMTLGPCKGKLQQCHRWQSEMAAAIASATR
jgi:hypothetical protein